MAGERTARTATRPRQVPADGPLHLAKLLSLRGLPALPGASGERFARRFHRRRRNPPVPGAIAAFEAVLDGLGPEAVCVDLGANTGEVTARMAARGVEVHAVEADPWAFGRLAARFAGAANVHLRRAAVGTGDGLAMLSRAPGFARDPARLPVGSSLIGGRERQGAHDAVAVPQIDIRRLLGEIGRPVAILKMDIEGAGAAVLGRLLDGPEAAAVAQIFAGTHEMQMPALRPAPGALRRRRGTAAPRINPDWQRGPR
ncbi:hypothetical protein LNKW23_04740 [Paralimibaculum aggregatum]|uniref:Methyltransferase FkbM domain-containing protein n=1 Tax=Paralimibaculum aggregatum TaxID=3036245 RepID=A0ABQ6LLF9_9RHOB|nr:FkbM family methyltransferase [Limibaculum sp. NKW23]GMG81261.1 hypothetical protein LNKW23_04740 [Limibaculum sp. NKW23]